MEDAPDDVAATIAAVESLGLLYEVPMDGVIELLYRGKWTPFATRLIPGGWLTSVVSLVPWHVPQHARSRTMWLLNEINFRFLRWGAFSIDPDDGQLVFEGGLLGDPRPTTDQIRLALEAPGIDSFWPLIHAVALDGWEIDEAITAWEAGHQLIAPLDSAPDLSPASF